MALAGNGLTVTMAAFDALLKNVYSDKKNLYIMDAFKNKLLTAMPKQTDATGRNWNISVIDTTVVGTAAQYGNQRVNATAGGDLVFQGLWKDKFASLFLDEKTIRMSISKEGAVDQALMQKIDGVRRSFNQSTEYQLFRSEDGAIAQVVTGTFVGGLGGGNALITLTTNTGIPASQYIKNGHVLDFGPNADGSSLRTPTMTVVGMGINGQFTVTGSAGFNAGSAGAASIALQPNDYIFIDGDALGTIAGTTRGIATGTPIAGMKSWIPTTDPLGTDSFKGVNRSIDPRGLAGVRIDATNEKVEEAFLDGVDVVGRFDGDCDLIMTHPTTLTRLKKEMSGQNRYSRDVKFSGSPGVKMNKAESAAFGFDGIALDANGDRRTIASSWACQSNLSWLLTMKHWKLWTNGPWPDVRGRDGLTMLRQADSSYIYELVGYGECVCYAPGSQGVIIHDNNP